MSTSEPLLDETRSRVLRGIAWKTISSVTLQSSRIVTAVLLARLLTPHDYGLAGMVLVVSALVAVFADLAFGAALIQRRTLTEADRSTVFWTSVGMGLLFTLAGVAASPLIADFYGEPDVAPLFAAFSLSFVVTALASTQSALLTREMNFRSLELRKMISYVTAAVVGVTMAAAGFGAWAIIAQQLVGAVVSTLLLIILSPWRPRFLYSLESLRRLGGFSANVFGARILFYFNRNADNLLIGRFLGPTALGAYTVSYNVMLTPMSDVAEPVTEVLFPAFSRHQNEPDRIAAAWMRVNRLVGTVTIPVMLGLIVVADDFVHTLLGDKWSLAVPVIQILAWVGLLQSLQRLNSSILSARDRTNVLLRYSVIVLVVTLASFVAGLPWGIVGVAAAYAIVSTFLEPYYTWLTARSLGVSVLDFGRAIFGVVQAAVVMAGAVALARYALVDAGVAAPARLGLLIVLGAAVYIPLCLWRAPEVLEEIKDLLARSRGRSAPVVSVGAESVPVEPAQA
jgi:O-antigen/teichoic acid export membrane protein